jgi:Uma2 family endonuclease
MTDDELFEFCAKNEALRVERDANGDLILMSPTGLEGSNWNSKVNAFLTLWAEEFGAGLVFDSNGGFTLPDGSMRVPDVAFLSWPRWKALPATERKRFGHVVPEFVVELRSESDGLSELQDKMKMWLANGVELAWLVDPKRRVVEVYRAEQAVEVYEDPSSVQGTGVVAGFCLVMQRVWG